MVIRQSTSFLIRELGAYAAIIAFCVGVVLWAPRFRSVAPSEDIDPRAQAEPEGDLVVNRPLNERGDTALHLAVREGNTRKIVELIENRADPNIENREGVTPLDLAHARGQEDIIGLLTNGSFRSRISTKDEPDDSN